MKATQITDDIAKAGRIYAPTISGRAFKCLSASGFFIMNKDRDATIDLMIEFVMEELLSGNSQRKRTMVRRMAERWPSEPALAIVFAVTSATSAIEDSFGDTSPQDPVIPLGYRISALISADVHAVQSMGQVPSVAEDLLHFWRRVDPLFLRLQ